MQGCATFLLEPRPIAEASLRRYAPSTRGTCPKNGYHDASTPIGDVACRLELRSNNYKVWKFEGDAMPPRDDPRWPKTCACGYTFVDTDEWQLFHEPLYRRVDGTDDRVSVLRPAPGAMWFSESCFCQHDPPCESHLMAVCPGANYAWDIDSRAANCTKPEDRTHRCWVRHGEPPNVTVDKNGSTCEAGAGSIVVGAYHGFLRNGRFTDG